MHCRMFSDILGLCPLDDRILPNFNNPKHLQILPNVPWGHMDLDYKGDGGMEISGWLERK